MRSYFEDDNNNYKSHDELSRSEMLARHHIECSIELEREPVPLFGEFIEKWEEIFDPSKGDF